MRKKNVQFVACHLPVAVASPSEKRESYVITYLVQHLAGVWVKASSVESSFRLICKWNPVF